ncbi:MAG: matrixin family metalloprotease [Candidatus Glassbacteria bacterium]
MKTRANNVLSAFIFSIIASAFLLTQASAFTTIGSWRDQNIPPLMSVNQNGTDDCTGEFRALYLSGMTWNNVSTSYFYFARNIPTFNTLHAGNWDGYNQLSWDPAPINDYIAVTYNYGWFYINETDISFNSNYLWNCEGNPSWNEMDVQNIATHELGHSLGLGHTSYYNATMYAYADYGETKKRSLHWDDIDGIEYLYPAAVLDEQAELSHFEEGYDYYLTQPRRDRSGLIEMSFRIPDRERKEVHARLTLYGPGGDVVRVLLDRWASPGDHKILWDGRNDAGEIVPAGIYYLTLEAGDFFASKKLLPYLFEG